MYFLTKEKLVRTFLCISISDGMLAISNGILLCLEISKRSESSQSQFGVQISCCITGVWLGIKSNNNDLGLPDSFTEI